MADKCQSARELVVKKSWEAIKYKYSPAYIEENKKEFEKGVKAAADELYNDCKSGQLSGEEEIMQGVLDVAAMPLKESADRILKGLGLPAFGDKALHIDIADIKKHGIFGGPDSFFRKPFG